LPAQSDNPLFLFEKASKKCREVLDTGEQDVITPLASGGKLRRFSTKRIGWQMPEMPG
jgi:hypothetical protein